MARAAAPAAAPEAAGERTHGHGAPEFLPRTDFLEKETEQYVTGRYG